MKSGSLPPPGFPKNKEYKKEDNNMTMINIFENNYNELTQAERDLITTTDLHTAETLKFDSVEDFKDWAADLIDNEE
jgi:hypothetical protein